MKRIGDLYNKVASIDNLVLADQKARKGKTKSYGVLKHDKKREQNIFNLHKVLVKREFKTSKYKVFKIYEPKEREIYQLPYYPDRIVHHAIMNILEPIWVSIFTADTYSCIKGKGIHAVLKDLKKDLRNNKDETTYCLKLDIRKFYPSIDHDIMKQIIRRKIKDRDLLQLLDNIIDSADGVPIGNYLSQYFANLYLAYFDHWIKEEKKIKFYYRYADDMVILHNDKEYLHYLFKEIETYLSDNLKLEIKDNWQVFPVEKRGIDFVGYVFYHTYVLLRKSIKQNFCRKVAKLNKKEISIETYRREICSWLGWCYYCNSNNLLNKIIKKELHESILR